MALLQPGDASIKFEVTKRLAATDVELRVTFDNEEEFDEAIRVLRRLEARNRLVGLKDACGTLWSTSAGSRELSSAITDGTHRVGIALFDLHPETLRTSDIAQMVGLAGSTVSNILNGTYGNAGYMFRKTGGLWGLSDRGIREVTDNILPAYLEGASG